MSAVCIFCHKDGKPRVEEGGEDVAVCDFCWKLLKDPKTALPLIRGHLSLTQRGKSPAAQLEVRINQFMGKISNWKPRN
jgi:hypothetical protein